MFFFIIFNDTSKPFLSIVPHINTSSNLNSNDKSYFSSYSMVFFKPIAKDVKYSSRKTEDPLPLKDGFFSDGPDGPVDSSCI